MEGILPLFKPAGMTSHDCVFKLRKILHTKKVGHTGTLDPDVTGVLPICIGRATKVAEYVTDAGKTYEGEVTIGFSTTTEDAGGDVLETVPGIKTISRQQILSVLQQFTGEIQQTPPMYSAVKVNGKKLYEYARAGLEVERPTRTVTIQELILLDEREEFSGETISFRFSAACSKGTYIRTLAVDIGEALGYPAHMSYLTRTQSAGFHAEDCYTLEQVAELAANGEAEGILKPLEEGLKHLPEHRVDERQAAKVMNGAVLEKPESVITQPGEPFVILYKEAALAVYKVHESKENCIKPVKVLRTTLQ
ncbi:tRNA pseudouridine(55) synthase TruB [Bacillus testis]|uniref:tRNA pseudouridine(55) synthase TruB n=1 Tax=Bacillus testis TaxID=1622072 RepID=UPI00067F691B|nr:tRNA pseudouridine(55) synthase TruB [Bacillus testis]